MQNVKTSGVVWRINGPLPKPKVIRLTPEELEEIHARRRAEEVGRTVAE